MEGGAAVGKEQSVAAKNHERDVISKARQRRHEQAAASKLHKKYVAVLAKELTVYA